MCFVNWRALVNTKNPLKQRRGLPRETYLGGKNRYIYIHTIGRGDFFPFPPPPISSQKFERSKPVILGSLISHRKKIQKLLSKISDKISIFQIWKINKIKIIFPDQDWPGYSSGLPYVPFLTTSSSPLPPLLLSAIQWNFWKQKLFSR